MASSEGGVGDAGGQPDGVGLAGVPCLYSINSTERRVELTPGQRRTAFALAHNVESFCDEYGIDFVGFLTLTFADHVTRIKEASRRFNSLSTHVLKRYRGWIAVKERQESGRLHFHLLVALSDPIRVGFDFEAAKKGDYKSAAPCLRREWRYWRENARSYGFGRVELLPVRSTAEGIGRYVGGYISKHIDKRQQWDKGARLVHYSKGSAKAGTRFAWASVRSWLWRRKIEREAGRCGFSDLGDFTAEFGSGWAFFLARNICADQLEEYPTREHAEADGRWVEGLPEGAERIRFRDVGSSVSDLDRLLDFCRWRV